ncbi:MAG: hypothetical protein K9H49_00710 [Bacteroidales bacterium]|nr:hypothetical protein [Bacteroidales bacterium]MCF8389437.1 hypothetical protein [Bacteroidales bacterium]
MNEFTTFFLHFIFISVFAFLIVVSIVLLKPFRVNQKRPISTILLKVSYLLFLIAFIILAYLILFFASIPDDTSLGTDRTVLSICYIIIMLSFFIPNLGIMLRRKVKKVRFYYNIVFTVINIFFLLAMVLMYKCFPFDFN